MFPELLVEEPAAVEVEARPRALEFLQAIYQNEGIALGVRMRAAIEALPFETPKLSATAIIPAGEEFAAKLGKAVERSRQAVEQYRQGPKLIEHSPSPAPAIDHRSIMAQDR